MNHAPSRLVASAAFAALALLSTACPRGGGDGTNSDPGDAQIRLVTSEAVDRTFRLGEGNSEVRITPPVGGEFSVSFIHPDPVFTVEIKVDSNRVRQGDTVTWPLTGWTDADMLVVVTWEGRTYRSDRNMPTGTVFVQTLENTDTYTEFRGVMDLVLTADNMATVRLEGYLEVSYGGGEF